MKNPKRERRDPVRPETFKEFEAERSLVSVRRDEIDGNSIQGFILGSSERLVALQCIYDFNLDGLMILRVSDVTEIRSDATGRFQREMLIQDELEQRVPFGMHFALQGWQSVIAQLSDTYSLMILEAEIDQEFYIGRVEAVGVSELKFKTFSGAGNWAEAAEQIAYSDITSCQVNTSYANAYQRQFDRHQSGLINSKAT